MGPYKYLCGLRGKKLRNKFLKALNVWFDVSEEQFSLVESWVEMAHTCTLNVDDIQDYSILRRGIPAAHLIYGIHTTIWSANYLWLKCLENFTEIENLEVLDAFLKCSLETSRGQGAELYWRDHFICPTVDEYLSMINQKTGGIFSFGAEALHSFSQHKYDVGNLVTLVGTLFQVRDDYLNLCSEEYAAKKTYCEDIGEGKFSFLIVHAVHARPDDKRLLNILKQKPKDIETRKYAFSLLKEFGSVDYTYEYMVQLKKDIMKELKKWPENPLMASFIEEGFNLTEFSI